MSDTAPPGDTQTSISAAIAAAYDGRAGTGPLLDHPPYRSATAR